jgi:molybdopterin converting factor small subunit
MQNLIVITWALGFMTVVLIVYCIILNKYWMECNDDWYELANKHADNTHKRYQDMNNTWQEAYDELSEMYQGYYNDFDTVANLINERNRRLVAENEELKDQLERATNAK